MSNISDWSGSNTINWGKSYEESWWGNVNEANSWGIIYPFNAEGSFVSGDSNIFTGDTDFFTADNAPADSFACVNATLTLANGTTGSAIGIGTDATVSLGTLVGITPSTYQSGTTTYTATITAPSGYSNSGANLTDCTINATGTSASGPGSIVATKYALLTSYGGTNITFTYSGQTYSKGLTETLSDITNLNGTTGNSGNINVRFDTASPSVGSYMTDGFGTFINSSNTHVSGFGPYAAYATPKYMVLRADVINPFGSPINVYPVYKIEQANGYIQITEIITS